MRRNQGCNPIEHVMARRQFLAGTAAGAVGMGVLGNQAQAKQLQRQDKRILQVFLQGGVSQLESWDPKPGTPTSGPFGAIDTNLSGVQISSLMPKCATIMDKLAVIRSMSTQPKEHFQGIDVLTRGFAHRFSLMQGD